MQRSRVRTLGETRYCRALSGSAQTHYFLEVVAMCYTHIGQDNTQSNVKVSI